jgi:signal transduction histidine kinase/ligand-binding sensor domain-containing protein
MLSHRFSSASSVLRPFWACLAALMFAAPAAALDQDRLISEFQHTAWTLKDGAPGEIWSLAQTADGWLWLGTTTGLYRFDGVRFEHFAPLPGEAFRSNSIAALFALPTGELWIGFVYGGASVLKDGHLTHFTERDGLPSGMVLGFETAADGALWMATTTGLMRYQGGRWSKIGPDWNYPAAGAYSLMRDQQGTLWAATGETVLALRPGKRQFEDPHLGVDGDASFMQAQDGSTWVRTEQGSRQIAAGSGKRDPWIAQRTSDSTLFDRDGALWTAACAVGVCRLARPREITGRPILARVDATDAFTSKNGLTADAGMTLLEDREGNIWFTTRRGLDRFRHSNIVTVLFPESVVNVALVADDQGAVWAGTNMRSGTPDWLWRIDGRPARASGVEPPITCAYRAQDGSLWFGGPKALWHKQGERFTRVELPQKEKAADVHAITQDGAGRLWIGVVRAGTFRLDPSGWTPYGNLRELPRITPTAAVTDLQGRVWFGYSDNRLARIEGDAARLYSAADGLNVGTVTAILARNELLVGGELGLAAFKNNRFHAVLSRDTTFSGITGLVETAEGDLWLNGNSGVAHVKAAEWRRALADPGYPVHAELFDFQDGLPGTAQQLRPLPTAIQSADGRLWFAATDGVAWLDPKRIQRNALAPPVVIRSLVADDVRYAPGAAPELPQHTKRLQIGYTALSLSIPERIRFRYQLEGVDEQWQDPGQRREAFYTNLRPRRYTFRIKAANNDGVWNETGAGFSFSIAPTFFQTRWFYALCIVAGGALLWLIFWLRMRQMSTRLQTRLQERLQERERIARELHDTLLQGIHGLTLRFQAAKDSIPEHEPARELMEKALDRADEVLAEGRDRVQDLRAAESMVSDLPQALMKAGEELAQDHPAEFRVVVEGSARKLHPIVRDEAYRIAREAMVNAFAHAQAKSIEAEVAYDRKQLRVRLRDDGRGIDQKILDAGGRAGHWGLTGMRERAQKIRGHFEIWSRPGAGTEIELRIPASIAYKRAAQVRQSKVARQ